MPLRAVYTQTGCVLAEINNVEKIRALECTYRDAAKAEAAVAAVKAAALEALSALRKSTGIGAPSVDETPATMGTAGIFYAWRRQGWRNARLARRTEKGLAPVVEHWLLPWLVEHVAVDASKALAAAVLKADPSKYFPVVDGVPS